MKPLTETIKECLEDEDFEKQFESLVASNPKATQGDVTVSESLEKYYKLKELLLQTIESGTINDIPYSRRNAINTNLNNAKNHVNNYGNLINHIEALHDQILIAGLFSSQVGQKDYEKEIKEISKLKKRLKSLISEIEKSETEIQSISQNQKNIENYVKKFSEIEEEVETLKSQAESNVKNIDGSLASANQTLESIKTSNTEVEAKKLKINTFHENVEEHEKSISDLEKRATELIAKEDKIKQLILDAEKALNLKSAQGLSAALSEQYEKANDKWIMGLWLIGAAFFLLVAIGLTIWVISGWKISNPDSWSSILGRIFAIGVAISGATFSAQRYVRQKQIAEDYAYKMTLAKSIIAFTEEIKKRDDKQVATYLTKVLDEIHKDPLRPRSKPKEITLNDKSIGYLEKLIDTIKTKIE